MRLEDAGRRVMADRGSFVKAPASQAAGPCLYPRMRTAIALAALLLAACSSSSSSSPSSSAGGVPGPGEGAADAGPTASVTPVDQLPEPLDLRVEAGVQGEGAQKVKFENSYVYNVKGAAGDRCTLDTSGACFVRKCAGTGALNLLDMGVIHVTSSPASWSLTPISSTYSQENVAKTGFVAGTAFNVTTDGGADVPAFKMEGMLPPEPPAWTTPTSSDAIVRGQPATFTWAAAPGKIEVGIFEADKSAGTQGIAEIRCHADGAAGTFTIPADVTAKLEANAPSSNWFYGSYQEYVVTIASTKLTVSAFSFIPRMASVQ